LCGNRWMSRVGGGWMGRIPAGSSRVLGYRSFSVVKRKNIASCPCRNGTASPQTTHQLKLRLVLKKGGLIHHWKLSHGLLTCLCTIFPCCNKGVYSYILPRSLVYSYSVPKHIAGCRRAPQPAGPYWPKHEKTTFFEGISIVYDRSRQAQGRYI